MLFTTAMIDITICNNEDKDSNDDYGDNYSYCDYIVRVIAILIENYVYC